MTRFVERSISYRVLSYVNPLSYAVLGIGPMRRLVGDGVPGSLASVAVRMGLGMRLGRRRLSDADADTDEQLRHVQVHDHGAVLGAVDAVYLLVLVQYWYLSRIASWGIKIDMEPPPRTLPGPEEANDVVEKCGVSGESNRVLTGDVGRLALTLDFWLTPARDGRKLNVSLEMVEERTESSSSVYRENLVSRS